MQFVAVVSAKDVAGVEIGAAFVVFPNLVVLGLGWQAAQPTLFEDIALCVAIQFQAAGFLSAVIAIGENNQNLALHFGGQYDQADWILPPEFHRRSTKMNADSESGCAVGAKS